MFYSIVMNVYFSFDPDPAVRHSFWTCVFGGAITWLAVYGGNQAQIQRAITCPTLRKAQWYNKHNYMYSETYKIVKFKIKKRALYSSNCLSTNVTLIRFN